MGIGQQPWQALAALPAWQVTEIPRPDPGAPQDFGLEERMQALALAYGCGGPVALAWLREQQGGPVRVLVAGAGLAGGEDTGQTVLTVPSGARGVPLPRGETAQALAGVPFWTRICGVTDVLLAGPAGAGGDGPSLERGLLTAWLDAFAWLVLAEPVGQGRINDLAADAARQQLFAGQNRSPGAQLAARRAAARHDELRGAITAGLWRVHFLAGGRTEADSARIARLLCVSADLRGLPYALTPRPGSGPLPEALQAEARPHQQPAVPPSDDGRSWWDTPMGEQAQHAGQQRWPSAAAPVPGSAAAARLADDERDTPVPQSPFHSSTRLLAALARGPAREVPGLRFTLQPRFDVTPEVAVRGGKSITAGAVLDWNRVPAGTLALPLSSLNRHVFVCGSTGAGKSQTVRNLLEQASRAGIPWLVVEPAKAEYRLMASRLPGAGVIAIRPGDLDQPAAGINPLEPAPGPDGSRFPLQTHADLLRSLFLAAFQADEPFPQVLAAALARCYEQAGWDLVSGQPAAAGVRPSYPGLEDLQSAALAVVDEAGYGREVRDNVRGFVAVRIGSLRLGTTGRFLDGGHPIDFAALLARNVVLEIEDAGDDQDKAFLMGAVLLRLTEHLRLRHRAEGSPQPRLRHLTVVEEAHRLLRQPPPGTAAGPASHATEMFADLLAEIRAYGEGLIIAEQIPVKLIADAVKNTAIKIAHRLPAADDRAVVGATMNLSEAQSQYLVTLLPGEAAVHADGMDYPLLVRMPDGTARETGTSVPAASPGQLITPRSITCGAECRAQPCTLGEMRAAQRAGVTDPRLTLWAELAVVAHLTGWPVPRPGPVFAAALQAMPARLRDCAFSHAVDAAVAARAPAISTRAAPAAVAAHVTAVMRETLTAGTPGCAVEEPEYLASPYRWMLVRDTLKAAARPGASGRHPRSDEWERSYGEPIPGSTVAEQARIVNRWSVRDHDDARAVAAVIWGTRPRTRIEQAVGTRADDPAWASRLTDLLGAFVNLTWPRSLFRRPSEGRRR